MTRTDAFKTALAARKGEIEPEMVTGAAKLIFRDKSLSDSDIEAYIEPPKAERTRPVFTPAQRRFRY